MYNSEVMKKPSGHIDAYMHRDKLTFIPVGDGSDPKQGYYTAPKAAIVKEMHIENLIVNRASVFMARRMTPGPSWGNGINYLEVGTGVGTGSMQAPQAEVADAVSLRTPLFRKAISAWTFLDRSDNPTASETNVIQLTTVFTESEAVGALTEMGLWGGAATNSLGTGYMFNFKTFAVWNKGNDMQLTIVWKVTL